MSESIEIVNNRAIGTTHDGVGKRHSDFSSTERMANWSGNRKWTDGFQAISDPSVDPTETTELWKTMGAASEEVFNELYTSVANLSDNISNLDLCTVSTLKDRAKEYGIDAGVMKIWENFPVEIAKMVDLFSINKAHLRGIVEEWSDNGTRKYGLTTIASKELWKKLVAECETDEAYRKFIRNTFYNTLESFVNMKPASGGDKPIWNLNGAYNRRFSTNLFSSRIEYANPVEAAFGSGDNGGSSDDDKLIYERKQQLGIPRYFSEKYYADEILIGDKSINDFTDAEQEIINMEIDRRKALWLNSGIDQYTYVREAKVLHYVRFVTLFANAIYDVTDYDLDKRKSELLDLDETKYLIRMEGGECSIDYSMIESVADVLTDYCINVSYFRETVRVQAQKNMLKGTKALLVDSIREILAKNVYSTYGGCENFWRQTNVDSVIGTGIEIPKDLSIDIIEYIDNTRYTNIRAREDDDKDAVNSRYWQISGVQGDLTNADVLDFYNRLTEYRDPWHIFQCANTTDDQKDPTYNLYQHLNYVFNSGAFSADLVHKVFDTELVASRLYPKMPEIYGYDEIVSLLRGSSTSAEVPNRLPKVFFDYDAAAVTLIDAFEEIDCGEPQYKDDGSDELTDDYVALYNRYHDFDTIRTLISSYKTPDEFISNASVIFPCAYFDTIKSKKFLYERIVYEDWETSSIESRIIKLADTEETIVTSLCSTTRTIWTSSAQQQIRTENGYTTIVTLSGSDVSTLPEKPYVAESGLDNSFDTAWNRVLASKYLQNPERMPEVFYYVSEYPSLYTEVFGDYSNYRHDDSISVINNLGEGYNYAAYNALYADETYKDSMIHESGTFGDALYDYIGDVTYGRRPYANSQNTVHPSVQVHAFVTALIEYVNSYHAIVRYLDISQPKFETYCQTVVDRVDKIGNTIHYWKNSVDDFSGYSTDYEKNGNDADSNASQDGPFNMDALQALLDDKALFIDTIKRETNQYYISDINGTFMLTESEKQSEIDNITIYYDDICRLATKEIAKFGRDKYGNTYVLYKDRGHRTDRDALGKLWIRKADRPLSFPGIVVDEINGKLSNASQVSLTDNSEIEKKIIEQYKYPQRYYDDINTVGCYLTDVVAVNTGNTRCYKVDWGTLREELSKIPCKVPVDTIISHIRDTNGYTALSSYYVSPDTSKLTQAYFTFDDDGSFVPSGLEDSIWDSGSATPSYGPAGIRGYIDHVAIGDYKKGDIVLEMENYEDVNYDAANTFNYKFKSGSDDVNEITFVVCHDDANVSGYANNFFLDAKVAGREGEHHAITYHNLTITGIYTIRLPRGESDTENHRGATITMGSIKNLLTLDEIIDDDDPGRTNPRTMVGTMSIGGDDTNEILVDFHGEEPTTAKNTVGIASIDGNGQNIGKYFDFTLNETLDVIVLDAKDPHYEGYDKSWAIDAMINRPNNTDGSIEIQFFKDSQHNVEYVHFDDPKPQDGAVKKYVSVHCGNVNAGNRVHAVFAKIEERKNAAGEFVPTRNISFSCNTFGYDRYVENSFVPPISYPAYKVNGRYHFRINSDDLRVYVAFCSELPDHNDRVGNYVSGYDGMVAGSTTFNRCSTLGYLNGVTIVGFDVTANGLADNGNVRYVIKNETLGYYPQYSGLIGRNMTYANSSMVGRDVFGFELMFDKIDGGEESIDIKSVPVLKDQDVRLTSGSRYDGGFFIEYTKNWAGSDVKKTAFLYNDTDFEDVNIGSALFYSMGYKTHDDAGVPVKDSPFALGFTGKIVAIAPLHSHAEYESNLPSLHVDMGSGTKLDVVLEDLDLDEDGNATIDSISYDISEVSNIDMDGNFLIVCRGNHVLSCQYSEEDKAIYVKSVTHFVMDDTLDQIENTFDGKFVAYPSKLNSGKINFIYAMTNPAGYLSVGYYVTEYADTATIKDIDIFNGSVFIIFDGNNIDHVFRVGKCFDVGEKIVEEFIVLDESGDGYSSFTSDNDHLFLMPSTLGGTVLIFNPQTDQFDDAYQLSRLVPKWESHSAILGSRIANENLRILVHETDDPATVDVDESKNYKEFYIHIGSECNYAILELDKNFPILVTYEKMSTDPEHLDPTHPGITPDDNIKLKFKCLFSTSDKGRMEHSLYSWERKTIDISYAKSTDSGKEQDAEERYGTPVNEYIYGDSRVYRITATGQRKFKIERMYRTGFWPTGEFDEDAYLSFTYDLTGYPNERRNKRFRHWNPDTTFKYTVSGPFSDIGYALGTQYDVPQTATEIEEKFKGMAISRSFDTYWLSGEMLHLASVPEPSSYEQRKIDCLVDSNLSFAKNTIISSCASMFEHHANLLCANRTLAFSYDDNSAHIRNTERMFNGDESLVLKEVDIVKSNVLNSMRMFEGCSVAPLIGAGFPENLTSVERMYCDCRTANFNWSMTMPGTVVSSLSSVFWNCHSGTFEYFSFDAFPRFRKVGDPAFDDEIITVADVRYDIYGVSSIASKSDNELNLNDDWTEVIWTEKTLSSENPEAGRFVEEYRYWDINKESGRFMSPTDTMPEILDQRFFSMEGVPEAGDPVLNFAHDSYEGSIEIPEKDWWDERFLTFDWPNYDYVHPILNFDDKVTVLISSIGPTHYDPFDPVEPPPRRYLHSGRFGEVVENSIIGDYMFWNTPKFAADYIGFVNVAHTLCSTISMFESCGKPYPDVGDEEDGRFIENNTKEEQELIYQERLFSFDMDYEEGKPLLNFSNSSNDLYPGLNTFNGTIQMPNLVTGRRMFRGSAFNFKDSTIVTGRAIEDLSEMFRRCEYITERGPRVQTFSFRGVMEIDELGKFNVVYIPSDMTAMYAECNKMPNVDIEILGNVIDITPDGREYPGDMFKCDFMFFGCSKLEQITGKMNQYTTTARGMFAKCDALTVDAAIAFVSKLKGKCDVTGMFYDCKYISGDLPGVPESQKAAKRAENKSKILAELGANVLHGDKIFDKPTELDADGKLPWGLYDGKVKAK